MRQRSDLRLASEQRSPMKNATVFGSMIPMKMLFETLFENLLLFANASLSKSPLVFHLR